MAPGQACGCQRGCQYTGGSYKGCERSCVRTDEDTSRVQTSPSGSRAGQRAKVAPVSYGQRIRGCQHCLPRASPVLSFDCSLPTPAYLVSHKLHARALPVHQHHRPRRPALPHQLQDALGVGVRAEGQVPNLLANKSLPSLLVFGSSERRVGRTQRLTRVATDWPHSSLRSPSMRVNCEDKQQASLSDHVTAVL